MSAISPKADSLPKNLAVRPGEAMKVLDATPAEGAEDYAGCIAVYDDGSKDVLAVAQSTLDQGPGPDGIARIVAGQWQRDGYIKQGEIVGVYRDPTIKVS